MGHDVVGRKVQEREAVRTTIVGGRPPGSGKSVGMIPRGVEVLLKKAAVDPAFCAVLLEQRAGAAGEIGLGLTAGEELMLRTVKREQLAGMIAHTRVPANQLAAFLGRVAAAMLAALGVAQAYAQEVAAPPEKVAGATTQTDVAGIRADADAWGGQAIDGIRPARPGGGAGVRDDGPERVEMVEGVRPDRPVTPDTQPGTRPATGPATAPATRGAGALVLPPTGTYSGKTVIVAGAMVEVDRPPLDAAPPVTMLGIRADTAPIEQVAGVRPYKVPATQTQPATTRAAKTRTVWQLIDPQNRVVRQYDSDPAMMPVAGEMAGRIIKVEVPVEEPATAPATTQAVRIVDELRVQLVDGSGKVVREGTVKLDAGQPVKGGEFRTHLQEPQTRGLKVRILDAVGREVTTEPPAKIEVAPYQPTVVFGMVAEDTMELTVDLSGLAIQPVGGAGTQAQPAARPVAPRDDLIIRRGIRPDRPPVQEMAGPDGDEPGRRTLAARSYGMTVEGTVRAADTQPKPTGELRVQLLDEAGKVVSEGPAVRPLGLAVGRLEYRVGLSEAAAKRVKQARIVDSTGKEVPTTVRPRVQIVSPGLVRGSDQSLLVRLAGDVPPDREVIVDVEEALAPIWPTTKPATEPAASQAVTVRIVDELRVQLVDESGKVVREQAFRLEGGRFAKGSELRVFMGEPQARGLKVRIVDAAGREMATEPAAQIRLEQPQMIAVAGVMPVDPVNMVVDLGNLTIQPVTGAGTQTRPATQPVVPSEEVRPVRGIRPARPPVQQMAGPDGSTTAPTQPATPPVTKTEEWRVDVRTDNEEFVGEGLVKVRLESGKVAKDTWLEVENVPQIYAEKPVPLQVRLFDERGRAVKTNPAPTAHVVTIAYAVVGFTVGMEPPRKVVLNVNLSEVWVVPVAQSASRPGTQPTTQPIVPPDEVRPVRGARVDRPEIQKGIRPDQP